MTAAAQRVGPPKRNYPQWAAMRLCEELAATLQGLRTDRFSWWSHWREIADYIMPRRYEWLVTPNRGNRGSPINQRILNNTGTRASRTCSSGLMAGMTSPGRPWFRLALHDAMLEKAPAVRAWLDDVETLLGRIFAESNFYNAVATAYDDLTNFGTSAMVIDEDYDDVIRCYVACAGEYYLAQNARLTVDTFYREYVQTIMQVVERFGLENCSSDVQSAYKSGGAQKKREVVIVHAIEPNKGIDLGDGRLSWPIVPRSFAWRECYYEFGQGTSQLLLAKGRHEFPAVCPRWDISGNAAYGRSPGMDALGDIKALQVLEKRKAQAIEKHVNPPLLADAQLKNEPATAIAGGVTYISKLDEKSGMRPLYTVQPELEHMIANIKEHEDRIQRTFFVDLFMMISQLDTVRTATEVDARREEKLIQLGPMLERFENECLDPAIERTFNIAMRAGILPKAPKEIQGQHIKVEYISMLAVAQRAAMTAAIERLVQFVGSLAGAVPDALDKVDIDITIDKYADYLGVSPTLLRPMADVMKMRASRAQQAQAQQAGGEGMAAVQAAQTMSQTDVGGGINALQAMIGNAGAGPSRAAA